MTQASTPTDFAVEITVCPGAHGPSLIPNQEYNFQIRFQDEIHMVRPLADGESLTLLLMLSGSYGTTIQGLSFGRTSDEAKENEVTLDTGGEYYGDTPFRVSPGQNGSAHLTVVHDASQNRYHGDRWFFDIWSPDAGVVQRIDPKIYNKTPDGKPPHKG